MTVGEKLTTFRHAAHCYRRMLIEPETATNTPTVDYMRAARRCQDAFGLFRRIPPTQADWDAWTRLHGAIVRCGSPPDGEG